MPLEDGDRTEALRRMGKTVIAIDLNPLSRTSRAASITIVDNVVRAIPNMVRFAEEMRAMSRDELISVVKGFNNEENLRAALMFIRDRLTELINKGITLEFHKV